MKTVRAVGLFSGGLDSLIALKMMQGQGIQVLAVSFVSPFFGNKDEFDSIARKNDFDLKIMDIGKEYINKVLKEPKYGYGKNMNPCVDCKIFMLKQAAYLMKKSKSNFVFTGEVVGQRPMSQKSATLEKIAKESGLGAKLLRPLSAKLLPETEMEKKGLIDRNALLGISGRGRTKQLELVGFYGLSGYRSPSGGCLLTEKSYSNKLKDLMEHKEADLGRVELLKIGRHFRIGASKIIVGRNEQENEILRLNKKEREYLFKSDHHRGPTVLLYGPKTKQAIERTASITAYYTDKGPGREIIRYGNDLERNIKIEPAEPEFVKKAMIT